MESVGLRLQETVDQLAAVERRIALYFMEHMDTLVGTPIAEIAEACSTTKSSVVRVCKQLGYTGYKDFLYAVSTDLALAQHDQSNYPEDIHPGSSIEAISAQVVRNSVYSLENTLRILDYEQLRLAVDAIWRARHIELFGVGASGIIAKDAEIKFRRLALPVSASADSHVQTIAASTLTRDDLVIAFSYQGETRDVLESIRLAKRNGATVISITKYADNTISRLADISLRVASNETLLRLGAMTSRLAMLGIVDILYTCVASERYDDIETAFSRTVSALQAKRGPGKSQTP